MNEIAPALNEREWAAWTSSSSGRDCDRLEYFHDTAYADGTRHVVIDGRYDEAERHAVAALCLYGQPFGFTREDVQALEELRQGFMTASYGRGNGSPIERALASLADRIAALLPPAP